MLDTTSTDVRAVPAVPSRQFIGNLAWIKGDGPGTDGTFSLIELLAPAGFETPWHVHAHQEYFYVIEGRIEAQVGEQRISLDAGDFAFGPRHVPHGFRVAGPGSARLLMMTNDGDFAEFIREASDPAPSDAQPEPAEPDIPRLATAAGRNGIELLGPLPF
jgi:quercetin dioxygenase-like cupin family protein